MAMLAERMRTLGILLIAAWIVSSCGLPPPAGPQLKLCRWVTIDPQPLWAAALAIAPETGEILLVDPGEQRLLVFSPQGEFSRAVESPEFTAIDYSSPLRLEAADDELIVGDRQGFLWLNSEYEVERTLSLPDLLGPLGLSDGLLSDFTVVGDTLSAYMDFQNQAEEWKRGFVRIGLRRGDYQQLLDLPIEKRGEFEAYYRYDYRPYLARLDRDVYALRYTDPPAVVAAGERGLQPIAVLPSDRYGEPRALFAWRGRLWILGREWQEDGSRWFLSRIDDPSGEDRQVAVRLPFHADRVLAAPGRGHWTFVEEARDPDDQGARGASLFLLPGDTLQETLAKDSAEADLTAVAGCAPLS